jgi:diguanylate cyclase (GGDEF)-like protein
MPPPFAEPARAVSRRATFEWAHVPGPVKDPIALAALALCVFAAVVLQFPARPLAHSAMLFLPAVTFTAAIAQLATFGYLAAIYRRTSDSSAAVLAAVYLCVGIVAVALLVAVPFGPDRAGLGIFGPSHMAWLWPAWHIAFPAGALVYAYSLARGRRSRAAAAPQRSIVPVALAGVIAGFVVVAGTILAAPHLPAIVATNLSGYRTSGSASLALLLGAVALVALLRLRSDRMRDRALLLALLAAVLDTASILLADARYVPIWYAGRLLYVVASGAVFVAALSEFARGRDEVADLRERLVDATRRTERHAARLRLLWQSSTKTDDDDDFLRAVLDDGAVVLHDGRHFDGFIAHLAGSEVVIDATNATFTDPDVAVAGSRFPIQESIMSMVLAAGVTRSWNDLWQDPEAERRLRNRNIPWRALIATPFQVGQTSYYVCFASPLPLGADGFSPLDHAYLETLASMCAARLHQRAQYERLLHQAEHDQLTGIANRPTFRARGFAALRESQAATVIVADIDAFREVNDTLGHQIGDALLVEVAARLAAHGRPDEVVARLGGDSFGILLCGVGDRAEAESRVRRYTEAFREPFGTGDREGTQRVSLTASFGIAVAPGDASGFEELLARADAATFVAKQGGRARWSFFDHSVEESFAAARLLQEELTCALARGEFVLHYQPHIEFATGRAAGVEALIRWNHPTRGLVSPADFIPFAERHGIADAIGTWVMHETIRRSTPWRLADPSFRVWFNVSQCELHVPSLAARLAELAPGLRGLGVEITEGTMMSNDRDLERSILMLRDAGFAIALDDFGTGYSSLSHLRRLPIDIVKIDRSFIAGIPHEGHDVAIVGAVLSIGRQYGFGIVAEGVETVEQAAFLAAAGCTYAQGYLYAKPMPADVFEAWLLDRTGTATHRRPLTLKAGLGATRS